MIILVATIYIICTFGQDVEIDASAPTQFQFNPSWSIDNMEDILNAEIGERFESAEFELGNATWQIISFPNGHNDQTAGCYMIFLALKQMPAIWKQVTLRFTISSSQIYSRFTRIAAYDAPKGLGWYDRSLLLQDLKQEKLDKLEWIVNIQILLITSVNDKVLYQYPLTYSNKQYIEWRVSGQLLESMRNASQGQVFEMPTNNDVMWTIRVIPNGKDNGFVDAFLQLFALPVNIWSIKVKYTLSCLETGLSDVYSTYFNYIDNFWTWPRQTLSFDAFKDLGDTVTFVVDMEILNYFDKDGYEVVTMAHILELKSRVNELKSIVEEKQIENNELRKDVEGMQQKMNWLMTKMETKMGLMMNMSQDQCF